MTPRGLDDVQAAFNRVAGTIDEVVLRNPINAWMREVSFRALVNAFPAVGCVLDLGCGTCEDAIRLAKTGRSVFAIDISEQMVEVARRKIAAHGVQDRVVAARGRVLDLPGLLKASPWKQFDGAYANFSLTYEESLEGVAAALVGALRPGARLLCSLPNRTVLSELLLYGSRLRFDGFLWRFEEPLRFNVHGSELHIRAYSTWQVRQAFARWFSLEGLTGVPVFLPPVYLHEWYGRLGGVQTILKGIDRRLARQFPWNRLGEHTLFRFRRRNGRERPGRGQGRGS